MTQHEAHMLADSMRRERGRKGRREHSMISP